MVRTVPDSSNTQRAARLATVLGTLLAAGCSGGNGAVPPPPPPPPSPVDTTLPTIPTGLAAVVKSAMRVDLQWSAASDNVGVAGYEVLRDTASPVGTTAVLAAVTAGPTGTSASDAGLAPSTWYCWAVRAFDVAGNRSGNSAETCTTTPVLDLTSPTVVETTPAPGATEVPPTAVFTVRFDEAVVQATLAGGGFSLRDAGSATVPAAVTWDASTLTATLTPSAPLGYLGRYTAVISTAVTDLAGNHVLAAVRWTVQVAVKPFVLQFAAGGSLGTDGLGSLRVAVADFGRDGHVDFAFVCGPTFTDVCVARGDGAGGFALPSKFPVGQVLSSLNGFVAADLDGDGYPDLAVTEAPCGPSTCLVNGSVDVLLNGGAASPGNFGPPIRLGSGMYPMDVVAADLDGDGKIDLASVDRWSDRLSVFLARGGGTFAPAVPYGTVDSVTLIAIALRSGGPIDLVPSSGPVLLGDGHGGFTPSTSVFAPGMYPMDVVAADLDLDGKVDLVVANDGTDYVTVLHGDGTGGFPTATTVQVGAFPGFVWVADLNGDGWPDLFVVLHQNGGIGTNASVVLLGLGGGEFGPPVPLNGWPFAVADVNGDGKPDLIGGYQFDPRAGTYSVDVLLNVTP